MSLLVCAWLVLAVALLPGVVEAACPPAITITQPSDFSYITSLCSDNANILRIRCPTCTDLSGLPNPFSATDIEVDCEGVSNLTSLAGLERATGGPYYTSIASCPGITDLSPLAGMFVWELVLSDLPSVTTLSGLETMSWDYPAYFSASFLPKLEDVSALRFDLLTDIDEIYFQDLPMLTEADLVYLNNASATAIEIVRLIGAPDFRFDPPRPFSVSPGADMCSYDGQPPQAFLDLYGAVSISGLPITRNYCPLVSVATNGKNLHGKNFGVLGAISFRVNEATPLAEDGARIDIEFPDGFTFDSSTFALGLPDNSIVTAGPIVSAGIPRDMPALPLPQPQSVTRTGSVVSITFSSSAGGFPDLYKRYGFSLEGVTLPLEPGRYELKFKFFNSSSSSGVSPSFRPDSVDSAAVKIDPLNPPRVDKINGKLAYNGAVAGGERITITGTDFGVSQADVANVTINAMLCSDVNWISSTMLSCIAPAASSMGDIGVAMVFEVFTHSSGIAPPLPSGVSFQYNYPVAHVTAINGQSANFALDFDGGQTLTLTGTDLGLNPSDLESITIGSMVCDKTYVSSSLVTCLTTSFTPADYSAAQAGSLEVNVRTTSSGADGTMAAPLALALVTRTPTVSQINGAVSATGSILGGESVTLTGTDLGFGQSDVLGVWLAHQACASAAWVSSTEVVCVTPAVPDAVRGPAVVQTASSGGVNSTSPSVVEFFFRREAQSLEESISFAVGAASSLALAFYWLIALVAAVAAFSLYKRSKNKKKALEWSRFRQVSFLEKLFTDHSVLGIAYYDESHPFTRFSRIITLVLEVLVNFLSVFLVTVVAPAVYEDSEASRQLRRETNTSGDWLLSLAMGTTLSILVGKPLLQHVLETSSSNIASGSRWSHRAIAQVAASFIDLVLLAINIILCIDPGLLLTSHLTVAIDTSNLLVRFVANMLLSWVITEPLLVLLKMKVWLDTVIRTNKYTVSEPDAKASNVVKMTAFFTDRADSDESDGHGVVSVPLATAAVAADGSSSALNDGERSSKLGSLSSSSSLAGSGSGSSRRPMQPPGAASPASRAMSRSHHKQRMSSSLSSEVVVIADDATIGGSAAPTPTRTRSKRTRRSRSSDNRGGDRSTSRKAAGGLLDALPEVGTRPLQRSRSGSKAEGLRTAALNDSPLLAVQDSTPISIDAVDIADAQAVRSPVSRTKAAMARTNSLPYNSSSRTRAGRLGGAPSRRASDRDIGRRRRTTFGNQDGTAVAAARSPLTRTNSRQTDAMRSPPRLSNVDDMSTTAASQTQSPSRRGSSLSSSVPVGATSSVSPARTGSSRALRGSPSRRATAIPGSASKPAMTVSRRDSLRPSASQRRGSSPLLQSPAETQT